MENQAKNFDEQPLIDRLKNGDEQAFVELVRRYSPKVIQQARMMFHSEEAAEDVAQEVFLQVFKSIKNLKGARIRPWLARITYCQCIEVLRKKYKIPQTVELDPDRMPLSAPENPSEGFEGKELLVSLTPMERTVVLLKVVEELSYEEISETTGLAQGSLRNMMSKALQKLREGVEKHGVQ